MVWLVNAIFQSSVFTWHSPCVPFHRLYVCVSLFTFSLSDTSHIRRGLTYPKVISSYLDYLCKNPDSKYCYKHKYCGLVRTWTTFWGRDTIPPITLTYQNVSSVNHCCHCYYVFFNLFCFFPSISMYSFYKLNNLNVIQKVR